MIRAVLFDFDGTLVDTERLQWTAYNTALAPFGVWVGMEEYRKQFIRVAGGAEWACRRSEIAALVQHYELGPKPPKPSLVSGAFDGTELRITAGEPARSVSFSVPIARPASAPAGPIPALIVIGRSALAPVFSERGVAVISFDNNAMGAQGNRREGDTYTNTRGQGLFYDLYGSDHPASSMMAWAWGVSRIIDVIESNLPVNRTLDVRETPAFLDIAHLVRVALRAGHSYDDERG